MVSCLNFLRKFLLHSSKLVLSDDERSLAIEIPRNLISTLSTTWLLIQSGVCLGFDLLEESYHLLWFVYINIYTSILFLRILQARWVRGSQRDSVLM